MIRPVHVRLHGGPGRKGRVEQIERGLDHELLGLPVIRGTTWVAERQIGEDEAGDRRLFDDVTSAADDDGGESGLLQPSSHQTHGLMTDRSKRDEQNQIDVVIGTQADDCLGIRSR